MVNNINYAFIVKTAEKFTDNLTGYSFENISDYGYESTIIDKDPVSDHLSGSFNLMHYIREADSFRTISEDEIDSTLRYGYNIPYNRDIKSFMLTDKWLSYITNTYDRDMTRGLNYKTIKLIMDNSGIEQTVVDRRNFWSQFELQIIENQKRSSIFEFLNEKAKSNSLDKLQFRIIGAYKYVFRRINYKGLAI